MDVRLIDVRIGGMYEGMIMYQPPLVYLTHLAIQDKLLSVISWPLMILAQYFHNSLLIMVSCCPPSGTDNAANSTLNVSVSLLSKIPNLSGVMFSS